LSPGLNYHSHSTAEPEKLPVILKGQRRLPEAVVEFREQANFKFAVAMAGPKQIDDAIDGFQKAFDSAAARHDTAQAELIREAIGRLRR
jgi:hypothetical protein